MLPDFVQFKILSRTIISVLCIACNKYLFIILSVIPSCILYKHSSKLMEVNADPVATQYISEKLRLLFTSPIPPRANSILKGGECSFTAQRFKKTISEKNGDKNKNSYDLLALSILPRILSYSTLPKIYFTTHNVSTAIRKLSISQSTLQNIDRKSHDIYQRTSYKNVITDAVGRAKRSAGRVGCCADALFACELCDWMEGGWGTDIGGTLDFGGGRTLLLNVTLPILKYQDKSVLTDRIRCKEKGKKNCDKFIEFRVRIVVLFEKYYYHGAGLRHGGIDGLTNISRSNEYYISNDYPYSHVSINPRGRILVLIQDLYSNDLPSILSCLDIRPKSIELSTGLISREKVCVNELLWIAAGNILKRVIPVLEDLRCGQGQCTGLTNNITTCHKSMSVFTTEKDNLPAIHFVGRSLAGGVASLSAAIFDGSFPMPTKDKEIIKNKRNRSNIYHHRSTQKKTNRIARKNLFNDTIENDLICGYGTGRTSALVLGPPPCLSSNIKAPFVTSVIHGNDIVSRVTKKSLDTLCERVTNYLASGFLKKNLGFISDFLSLTTSNLKDHARGRVFEEDTLSILGKKFIIRSHHNSLTTNLYEFERFNVMNTRDTIRASVLWQMNDIVLSHSLWNDHPLCSYIDALDRVQLREVRALKKGSGDEIKITW